MKPEKTFCRDQLFWMPNGETSMAAVIQGNSKGQ